MKAKPLPSRAMLWACFDYDASSGGLLWKIRPDWTFPSSPARPASWRANQFNNTWAGKPAFTAVAKNGYLKGAINGVNYYAHRVIWKLLYGTDPDDIDHENGVRSDNRKKNLTSKNRSGNLKNRCLGKNNTSGFHGVSYNRRHKLWAASIYNQGKSIHLGWFKDKADAIAARQQAEIQYDYHPNHGRAA